MTSGSFHQLFPHAATLIISLSLLLFSRLSHERLVRLLRQLGLVWLAVLLLSLSQPPHSVHLLAWTALVPLFLLMYKSGPRRSALLFWLGGWLFFLISLAWLRQVTVAGLLMLSFYLSWYFLAFGILIRWIDGRLRLPLAISAPVVWVALEYLRSHLLTGFPWLLMGHSQHANLSLIQMADFAGVYGVSFVILAFNGFLTQLVRWGWARRQKASLPRCRVLVELAIACGLLIFASGYGWFRLAQSEFKPGPRITLVQGNIPQSLKLSGQSREEIFEKHMRLSHSSLEPADLLVWPETMVLALFSQGRFWQSELLVNLLLDCAGYPTYPEEYLVGPRRLDMHEQLVNFARSRKLPLLVGSLSLDLKKGRITRVFEDRITAVVDLGRKDGVRLAANLDLCREKGVVAELQVLAVRQDNCTVRFRPLPADPDVEPREGDRVVLELWHNSAIYISQEGEVLGDYDKLHLVPFGEYTPLKHVFPFLARLVPYQKNLIPGIAPVLFELEGRKFGVVICFEDTVPGVVRQFARQKLDFLVNISNDAWFDDGWFGDTGEVDQHLAQACFRAVENRLPIARASNTGISSFVRSDGKVIRILTDEKGDFRKVSGVITEELLLDGRRSFYTRFGDIFAQCCLGAWGALVLLSLFVGLRGKK